MKRGPADDLCTHGITRLAADDSNGLLRDMTFLEMI